MRFRLAWVILAMTVAVPTANAVTLNEAWFRVQQALGTSDSQILSERIRELEHLSGEVGVRRLPDYASALVTWADARHDEDMGRVALRGAQDLDPLLPDARFLAARWRWIDKAYLAAIGQYTAGLWCLVAEPSSRRQILSSLVVWFLLALGLASLTVMVVQAVRSVRELLHDATEIGLMLFRRPNAIVLAVVLVALPVAAGLGPLWLLAWIFALSWAYLRPRQRWAAGTACAVALVVVPALDAWQQLALRSPSLDQRAMEMLDERRVDLSTMAEFNQLESHVDESVGYHMVLGEMLRMHSEVERARLQFQKASVISPTDATPLVFLGNLALEQGAVARAVQSFNTASQVDPRDPFAYYNLSHAYDRSYRFRAADTARSKAEQLVDGRLEERGIRGQVSRVLYPRLTGQDVQAVFSAMSHEQRIATGLGPVSVDPLRWFLNPWTFLFLVSGVVGVIALELRRRYFGTASTCNRCGKVFCSRCKTSSESASYCSQCISVFLKRDVVSIEQQSAKLQQIRRWEVFSAATRRLTAALLPGSGPVFVGALWQALGLSFLAWLLLVGALIWLPLFIRSVQPYAMVVPVQILFMAAFFMLWLSSVVTAWHRR